VNEKELIYILTVAHERSFSVAAEQLKTAQSTLSRCVQKEERRLGCELFRRTGSGLVPTEAGQQYLSSAKKILTIQKQLETDIYHINNLQAGKLKLAITPYLGTLVLPTLLRTFNTVWPGVSVDFEEVDSVSVERLVSSGSADVGLLQLPMADTSLCSEPFADDDLILVLAADDPVCTQLLPATDGLENWLDPALIRHRNFILTHPYQRSRQLANLLFSSVGIIPQVRYETSSPYTAVSMAAAGLGLSLLPRSYLNAYKPTQPKIVCCRMLRTKSRISFAACYLRSLSDSRMVTECVNVCKATLPYLFHKAKPAAP